MADILRAPRNTPIRNYNANLLKRQRALEKKSGGLGGSGKISNLEWGIVILCLGVADLFQFFLSLTGIGEVVSEFIDITVGFLFGCWLTVRGQSFRNARRAGAYLGTFAIEFIPFVNDLPLWTLDGFYNMSLDKAEQALEKAAPKVAEVANVAADYKQRQFRLRRTSTEIHRRNQEAKEMREERRNRSNN